MLAFALIIHLLTTLLLLRSSWDIGRGGFSLLDSFLFLLAWLGILTLVVKIDFQINHFLLWFCSFSLLFK